ncbi:MAG: LysM peptidoglycan-binding domain-containing protein [Salaquimonas sp.]|nr:LysM peptidoglycan-binding domain-containing protein [Salaquimonas sp.]
MISEFFRNNRAAAWLVVIVLAAAAIFAIQYSQKSKTGEQVAALPQTEKSDRPAGAEQGTQPRAGQGTEQPAETAPTAETEPEKGEQPQQAESARTEPSFDVLRVEKDGSTVIAGTGPANSLVEILSGGQVLASAKSGASGDFAIVFDKPLAAGDHELSIRATPENGEPVTSSETGVVHVPGKSADGDQVIAMVAKEGEASRVMQAPEAATGMPSETASGATEKAAPAGESKTAEAPVAEEAAPAGETRTAEAPAAETKPAEAAGETSGESSGGQVAGAAPEPKAGTEGQASEEMAATEPDTGEPATGEPATQEMAAKEPAAGETAQETPAPATQPVLVKAVDVDSGKIFVAGTGEPGRKVNIYVDDTYLGTTEVGPEGGFLLEAQGRMTAGKHEVRADMLAVGSAEVTNRAIVPLIHDVPEVAAAEKPAETGDQKMASAEQPAADQPSAEQPTIEQTGPEQPAQTGEQKMASAEQPTAEQPAKTSEETAMAEKPAVSTETGTAGTGQMATGQEQPAAAAETSGQVARTESQGAGETAGTPPTETVMAEKPSTGSEPAAKPADEPASTTERMAAAPKPEVPKQQMAAADSTVMEPEALHTGANVIIRHGDNLWTISRRMLGAGIKYTIIYEANSDQIRDPHWIYPGQVFDVPGAKNEMPRD